MIDILDASAMIAYLMGEPGSLVVESRLKNPSVVCYAHSINLCEVYYDFVRMSGQAYAELTIQTLLAAGVIERTDMDPAFWRQVGNHKSRGGISLADCFCLSLAERLVGQVVTADRKEFTPLVPLNICPILFIR